MKTKILRICFSYFFNLKSDKILCGSPPPEQSTEFVVVVYCSTFISLTMTKCCWEQMFSRDSRKPTFVVIS